MQRAERKAGLPAARRGSSSRRRRAGAGLPGVVGTTGPRLPARGGAARPAPRGPARHRQGDGRRRRASRAGVLTRLEALGAGRALRRVAPPPRPRHRLLVRPCVPPAARRRLEDRDRAALAEQLSRQLASFASQHARASAAAASAVSPGYDAGADEGAEEPGVERERLFVAQQAAALRVRLVHGLLPTLHDQRPAPRRRRRLRRVPLRLAGGVPAAAPRLPAHPRRPRPTPLPQRPEAQASRYPLSGPCTEALDVDLLQVQV
eukprot:tig00000042_g15528.t1